MRTTIKHIPSGRIFESRKDAKLSMGHSQYNKALKNGEMVFITTYAPSDVII
jgi:hypothetical protein